MSDDSSVQGGAVKTFNIARFVIKLVKTLDYYKLLLTILRVTSGSSVRLKS